MEAVDAKYNGKEEWGFSPLLVSSLNSVKYCVLSVGEEVKFRII
jgi:hypothetical protein